MKITIISSLYAPFAGGAEKAATLLAETLVREGYQVSVITLHNSDKETLEHHNGVRIHRIPMDNIYWPFSSHVRPSPLKRVVWHLRDIWNKKAAQRVGRILDLEKPDVVHTHVIAGFSVSILREVKRRQIRLVHTMHDYYLLCIRSSMFKNGATCRKRCTTCALATSNRKVLSRTLDATTSVSKFVLDAHMNNGYFVGADVHILPNISPATTPTGSARSRDALVFGFIGKLEPQKGIDILLNACALLREKNWHLLIAGTGNHEYVNDLKSKYTDSRLEWLGFMNAQQFFSSIDVCIVPSVWPDPWPYVAIEAMYAGKSLITARSGGLAEMSSLGKNFHMVSPGDSFELAQLIDRAIRSPHQWKEGGFLSQDAIRSLSPEHVLSLYLELYQNQRTPED